MKRIMALFLWFVLIVCLSPANALAKNTIDFACDRQRLTTDDSMRCEVTLTYEDESTISDIHMPAFRNFRILDQSNSTSRQISIINFKKQETVQQTTSYVIAPTRQGRFVIGPASFKDNGRLITSQKIQVEVSLTKPVQALEGYGEEAISAPRTPAERQQGQVFLRLIPEQKEVYLGQQFVITLYIYIQAANISKVDTPEYPDFSGFSSQPIDIPQIEQRRRQYIEGELFDVIAIERRVLFPTKTGDLTIGSYRFRIPIGSGFFGRGRELLRKTPPVHITVKPLPEEGRPANFRSTHVGRFNLRAHVDRHSTELNQPAQYTLVLDGEGNMDAITLPAPATPQGIKTYPPTHDSVMSQQNTRLGGQKKLEILYVPETMKPFSIPSISFSYFDPYAEAYKTIETKPFRISVMAPKNKDRPTQAWQGDSKQVLQFDAGSLRPLHLSGGMTKSDGQFVGSLVFMILFWGPPLLTLLLLLVDISRRLAPLLKGGEAVRRARELERLTGETKAAVNEGGEAFYGLLAKLLVAWAEADSGQNLKGLTHAESREKLRTAGWNDDRIANWRKLMDACDAVRFAGAGDAQAAQDLWNRVQTWRKDKGVA